MKIELDKQKKIALLQAIADGAIETDVVTQWGNADLQKRADDDIIKNIIGIESKDDNHTICRRRIELKKCPYNKLATRQTPQNE